MPNIADCALLALATALSACTKSLPPARPANISLQPSRSQIADQLAAFCHPAVDDHNSLGCRECPSFTARYGFVAPTGQTAASVGQVHAGHFTRSDANEIALTLSGCEGHVDDYGGTVLFERAESTGWRFIRYFRGRAPDDCKAAEASDRTLLLCSERFDSQGAVVRNLTLEDFGPGGLGVLLARTVDVTGALCMWPDRKGDFRVSRIEGYEWTDVNHDGRLDVVATVAFTPSTPSPDPNSDTCPAQLKEIEQTLTQTLRHAQLQFLAGPSGYRPTPTTTVALGQLE